MLTLGGGPFSVFTPYKNAWLKKLAPYYLKAYPVAHHASALAPRAGRRAAACRRWRPSASQRTNLHTLRLPSGPVGAHELLDDFLQRIDRYHETRDFPAVKGPSYLSTHLRFGTVSIRQLAREANARREAGLARRRGLAVGADLARLLPPGAAPPPTRRGARLQARIRPHPLGARQTRRRAVSRPGAKAAPATRWWTPPCTRSTRPATCTTGCAWWWRAS